jgi:hypothetical protein
MGTHADYATPLNPQKSALTSSTSGGRSVSTVRLRTKSHGVCLTKPTQAEMIQQSTLHTENETNQRLFHYLFILLIYALLNAIKDS